MYSNYRKYSRSHLINTVWCSNVYTFRHWDIDCVIDIKKQPFDCIGVEVIMFFYNCMGDYHFCIYTEPQKEAFCFDNILFLSPQRWNGYSISSLNDWWGPSCRIGTDCLSLQRIKNNMTTNLPTCNTQVVDTVQCFVQLFNKRIKSIQSTKHHH